MRRTEQRVESSWVIATAVSEGSANANCKIGRLDFTPNNNYNASFLTSVREDRPPTSAIVGQAIVNTVNQRRFF
jgi:hypothetical protein